MQELIDKLISRAGISQEQATHVLDTIKSHISEKFPAFASTIEGILGSKTTATDGTAPAATEEGFLQKATHFAKDHAGSLEAGAKNLFNEAEGKIKGMFN